LKVHGSRLLRGDPLKIDKDDDGGDGARSPRR
jgi:hypothetical protein